MPPCQSETRSKVLKTWENTKIKQEVPRKCQSESFYEIKNTSYKPYFVYLERNIIYTVKILFMISRNTGFQSKKLWK